MNPMLQAEELTFLSDRTPFDVLKKVTPSVIDALSKLGGGIEDKDNNVQFCGLIHGQNIGGYMFLPRTAICADSESKNFEIAKLTMRALTRYGAETSKKDFEEFTDNGNAESLAIVERLTDDFRANGLFSERRRLRTRNYGKPDWLRTIKQELPAPSKKKQPVFANIRATRPYRNHDNLLTQIQAAVLREIISIHGWWLRGGFSAKSELEICPNPPFKRHVWTRKLNALLPSLYSSRSIRLARYLRNYLDLETNSEKGPLVFGVRDFHNVWESVLRETLRRNSFDRNLNWNSRLPKPFYVMRKNGETERSSGMRMDIVLEHDAANFTIVDAKYYNATEVGNSPGWSDIGKQILYEKALSETVLRHEGSRPKIRNIFAFPSLSEHGSFKEVEMSFDGDKSSSTVIFPPIECVYIPIQKALELYVRRIKGIKLI
jgi:hypothetical protein